MNRCSTFHKIRCDKLCKTNFLNFMRLREWMDMHKQLRRLTADLGFTINDEPASYDAHTPIFTQWIVGQYRFPV